MGLIKKEGEGLVFQQDDGEITARFIDYEEKMELSHEGHPTYQKVFKILVLLGVIYLVFIFYSY
jgi:hypothetical protein